MNQESRKTTVVIGAGMIGISTALRLQADGHIVSLIDPLNTEQAATYGNAGALNPSSVTPLTAPGLIIQAPKMLLNSRSPLFLQWRYLPKRLTWFLCFISHATKKKAAYTTDKLTTLVHNCLKEHQDLAIGTEAADFIKRRDFTVLYKNRTAYEADQYVWEQRKRVGLDWYIVEGEEFKQLEPELAKHADFAVRMKEHGIISNPGRYLETLIDHFTNQGGTVIQSKATGFVTDGSRVISIQAEGQKVDCDKLVITAGVWSGTLVRKLGFKVPIESERGYHIEFTKPSFMPKGSVNVTTGKFFMTPMEGRLRCTSIVEIADINAPANPRIFDILLNNIQDAFPELRWNEMKTWMGHRPSTTDSLPVIGKPSNYENVYLGFGHNHIGLMSGPKTGRILADIISDRTPDIDISAFDVKRFQ